MDKISFGKELEELINRHSIDNDLNTPDFILSEYVIRCLENFSTTTLARDGWVRTPIQINSNWCNCQQSEYHNINGAMICARCNKPMTNLANL